MSVRRLPVEAIIELNKRLGCTHGVRDAGALDSAAWRPFDSWGDVDHHPTLAEKAAILIRGIAANHAFIDGNKRTAWLACVQFLHLNGAEIDPESTHPLEPGQKIEALVKHEIDVMELGLWLAERII